MTVDPATAKWSHALDGHTWYFCGKGCMTKFAADPAKYLAPAPSPSVQAEPAAPSSLVGIVPAKTEYICPMDPEVVQDHPGSCPKCGMALEPRIVALDTYADDAPNPELADMSRRFWISAALSLPLLALSMSEMIPEMPVQHALGARLIIWIELLLATPVVLWGALPFFERGARSLVSRHLNMFTLISLGVGIAYAYSVFAAFFPGLLPNLANNSMAGPPLYFEAAAVITALVLLGQVLELRARGRTASAIKALLGMSPRTARIVRADGREEDVALEEVQMGDLLRVRPGEKIPVDGAIVEPHMREHVRLVPMRGFETAVADHDSSLRAPIGVRLLIIL